MRPIGLEPTQRELLDPKSSASTNFATGANAGAKLQHKIQKDELFIEILHLCNLYFKSMGASLLPSVFLKSISNSLATVKATCLL